MTSKSKRYCSVPQCSNYVNKNITLHWFPKEDNLQKKWQLALKIGKPISKCMCVCSEHFLPTDYIPRASKAQRKRLKRGAVPSQKVPCSGFQTSRKTGKFRKVIMVEKSDEFEDKNEPFVEKTIVNHEAHMIIKNEETAIRTDIDIKQEAPEEMISVKHEKIYDDSENEDIQEEADIETNVITNEKISIKEEILDPLETIASTSLTQFHEETTFIKCEEVQTDDVEDEGAFGKLVDRKLQRYNLNVQHAIQTEILSIFRRADQGYYCSIS